MTSTLPLTQWAELPAEVREAVEERAGPVTEAEHLDFGEGAELASILTTPDGKVFAKGTFIDGPLAPRLDSEARINPRVARLAPRLLWRVAAGKWLVAGFAYVPGRHADYSPGSPDLDRLAEAVAVLQDLPCPDQVTWRVERRWSGFTDQAHVMTGEALVHKDLNPRNVLITEERAYVVDWATPCRGAAWVEPALLVPRLVGHGHSPREAEEWVAQFPSWSRATAGALDVFADAEARKRQWLASEWPLPRQLQNAKGAWKWARWRSLRR